MKRIYTIGHSSHTVEYFLSLLNKYEINCVIDIRSVPFSKYVPQYNKDTIKAILNSKGIYCIYMGEELGIVQKNREYYSKEGYLDFIRMSLGTPFKGALERIDEGIKKGYRITIMCTEKDPIDCHRSVLIGRELKSLDYDVQHIMPDGALQTQGELEIRLADMYFGNKLQESFFNEVSGDNQHEEVIKRSYVRRNIDLVKKIP